MNTNSLKKFATTARRLLMSEAIGQLKYLRVDSPDELPFLVKNGVQVRDIIFLE
jgi:hypothetical protein